MAKLGFWVAKSGGWVAKVGEWAAKLKGWVDKFWECVAKQEDGWLNWGMDG